MTKEEKIARYSKLNQEVVPGKMFVPKKGCGTHIYYIIMYSYIYNKVR